LLELVKLGRLKRCIVGWDSCLINIKRLFAVNFFNKNILNLFYFLLVINGSNRSTQLLKTFNITSALLDRIQSGLKSIDVILKCITVHPYCIVIENGVNSA